MLKVIESLRAGTLFPAYDGLIGMKKRGPYVLLNYTQRCQYARAWDEVTTVCRGLIVDTRDWSVVARPLDKFFNVNEVAATQLANLPYQPFQVFEKIDGSFGEAHRDEDGSYWIATRGSFDSPQALRGTEMLRKLPLHLLPAGYTPIFEIVYDNQHCAPGGSTTAFSVIKYGYEGLVLLAMRHNETGEELPWEDVVGLGVRLGVRLPETYAFASIAEVIASAQDLPKEMEGYVVRFANGLRLKIKGKAYLELNAMAWDLTDKRVLDALVAGTYAEFVTELTEELRAQAEELATGFAKRADKLRTQVDAWLAAKPAIEEADRRAVRKAVAAWAAREVPPALRGAFFQRLDGQEPPWYKLVRDGIG